MSIPDIRQSDAGKLIELFQIDLTELNNDVSLILYITNSTDGNGGKITFDSIEYDPVPVQATGFEMSTEAGLPTPTFSVGNANGVYRSLVLTYNDFKNAKLTRITTFEKYLDGQDEADPTATLSNDLWYFDRKTIDNDELISWELKSILDLGTTMIPPIQVLPVCGHTYRKWNGSSFTQGSCPYVGDSNFDINLNATSQANDLCGKRVKHCKARFGQNAELPFLGFPSVRRS